MGSLNHPLTYYEFFAGGGMARAGLGAGWQCLFANDIDLKKAAAYARNWGGDVLRIADVAALSAEDLPARAGLAWASFPCQDLSLAGAQRGLNGARSGTFWPFWRLMNALAREGRAPLLIVLENVCGALTSHGGNDFAAIGEALAGSGYRFGALVIDAAAFVPQSRPRLFIVAAHESVRIPEPFTGTEPRPRWHPEVLTRAVQNLPRSSQSAWIWWSLPEPAPSATRLAVVIEEDPAGVRWHTASETRRLLGLMTPLHRARVEEAKRRRSPVVGTVYRRTRADGSGGRVQRAEVRFDGLAGCLRTPAGGSSRQTVLIVDGNRVRSRLLSPRESARLMGLPDTYELPLNPSGAWHLTGDGVAVPVVRHLAGHLLEPLLTGAPASREEAA